MKTYKIVIEGHVSLNRITKKELLSCIINRTKLFLEDNFVFARKTAFKRINDEQFKRLELRVITNDEINKTASQEFLFKNIPFKYFSASYPEAVSVQAWNVYYQPDLKNEEWGIRLFSFQVYDSKIKAQKDFPDKKILEYSKNEIENPTFVD